MAKKSTKKASKALDNSGITLLVIFGCIVAFIIGWLIGSLM